MLKPFEFVAQDKPFRVVPDFKRGAVVTGYTTGREHEYFFRFTRPVPVKRGDVFRAAPGRGLVLNGTLIERTIRPPKGKTPILISWVAKKLRVAVFQERDPIWNPGGKNHGKPGKPHWTACDVRSYHVGCADSPVEAIRNLLEQCSVTNLIAEEERAKGRRVVRWRCLLPKKEASEMEARARKNGLILDGVEVGKSSYSVIGKR